jgi:hypothetical protein
MTKRSIITAAAIALTLTATACGGGSGGSDSSSTPTANQYDGCSSEGANAQSPGGVPLQCVLNSVGELMWDAAPTPTTLDAGSIADATSTTMSSSGASGSSAIPLKSILGGECNPNGPTTYSAGIGDAAQWSHVVPLGAMVGTHVTPVDHIYIYYPKGTNNSAPGTFKVTSPADGTIVGIEDFQKSNGYPYPDYRIVIAHSCDLYSVFIHVGELQGPAAQAAGDASRNGRWSGSIAVKAGDVIADESKSPNYDFSTFATKAMVSLLNPDSYREKETWKPYTANPFDYFPANIKAAYEGKTLRTAEPIGGTIFYDVDGTAQGMWFVQGTNGYRGVGDESAMYDNNGKVARGYWDTHLAFAPDNVDPSAFIYSIGDWEGCPCQFMSKGNLNPSSVKVSNSPTVVDLVEYEYTAPDGSRMDPSKPVRGYKLKTGNTAVGSVAFQVNADGSMTVEKRPGKDAASFTGFSADALTYVR